MKKQSTLELLLEKTEELIIEKGCQKTTLKDIMERTELTKGGIYHYVKSKNELFASLLTKKLQPINQRFYNAAQNTEDPELGSPLSQTMDTFTFDPSSVSNEILMYLLTQRHDPDVAQLLNQHHETFLHQSIEWIQYGQENGVIPKTVDATQVSNLFLLIGYGLNVSHAISGEKPGLSQEELQRYMGMLLGKE